MGQLISVYNLLSTFIVIGIIESIVKPIAKKFIQRKIIKYAPVVFKTLDPIMPELIKNCSPEELEQIVRDTFSHCTGEDWTNVNIEPFWVWYDPRQNAKNI